jgi:adenylate kinase family enzyme
VGLAGCGKSTLGRRLSASSRCPLVELDDLFWDPGWQTADLEVFRTRTAEATAGEHWVACGSYLSRAGDLLLSRADTIVWLDVNVWRCLAGVEARTFRQAMQGTETCNGNVNRLRHLWSSDAPFRYTLRTHRRQAQEFRELLDRASHAKLATERFTRRADAMVWAS